MKNIDLYGRKEYEEINELLNRKINEKKTLIAVHRGMSAGNIIENKKYTYNYEQLAQIINVSLKEARKPTDEYVYIR